ncbi:glycosyltransferase family 2 protein [Opitutales bacterium]|nr:glycosyltransferase family 2 protein [Opitutales bacterium]
MSKTPKLDLEQSDVFELLISAEPLKSKYEVGLVITSFNRPTYLHRTLSALSKSDLSDTLVLLVDDCSEDSHTQKLVRDFHMKGTAVIKAIRKTRGDCVIHENLKFGWDLLENHFNCQYLTNLDSDALVKLNWLRRLKKLAQQLPENEDHLITGLNAYQHKTLDETDSYYEKESIGGINFFFQSKVYQETIRPSLVDLQWDHNVVAQLTKRGHKILSTKPSVVQHIGRNGIWSGPASGIFDFAIDFGDTVRIKKTVRMIYFRGCRKMLFVLSPLFLGACHGLRKLNFLPTKLTQAVSNFPGSIVGFFQRLWF